MTSHSTRPLTCASANRLPLAEVALACFLLVLIAVVAPSSVSAETSVWRVSNGDNTVYLGGTVHLLRASDYPLPTEYDVAYAAADNLVFETDIAAMSDLATQARLLAMMSYTDERTLQSVLSEEAYAALESYTAEVGLPIAMMQKFKPGMVITTLQVFEFQKLGFTPEGVDAHFNTRANSDGKAVSGLESLDEQIEFLASMGEGNESEYILMSIADLESTEEAMLGMISAWRSGNAEQLTELFVDDMQERAPEIYELLLRGRNLNWLPQIQAMLQDEDTEFVLVGAAHLVGEDGLLTLLGDAGYEIEQL